MGRTWYTEGHQNILVRSLYPSCLVHIGIAETDIKPNDSKMRLVLNRVWIPAAYRQQPQSEWLLVSPFGRRPSLPWEHLPGLGLRDHVPRTDGRDGLLLRWEGNNGGKYPRGLHGEGNCRKTKGEFTLSRDAKLVRQKIWNVNFCLTCSWRIVFYVRRHKLKLSFMINRLWTSIVFWYFASLLRFNDEGTNIRQSSFKTTNF